MIKDILNNFFRAWDQYTGLQTATLIVMTASFTVVTIVVCLFLNLGHVLTLWGESVQLTVYLEKDTDKNDLATIEGFLRGQPSLSDIKFFSKESSLNDFKQQMSTYAPGLFDDPYIAEAIPDSFQAAISTSIAAEKQTDLLAGLAQQIRNLKGVEDITYGEDWVVNYSNFVQAMKAAGLVMISLLLVAGLLVIGNSIRLGIAQRREEIEILELIGATRANIQLPYICEGAIMGFLAAGLGELISYAVYGWSIGFLSGRLAFLRLVHEVSFLNQYLVTTIPFIGAIIGALGAWLCVRHLNDNWAAAKRISG